MPQIKRIDVKDVDISMVDSETFKDDNLHFCTLFGKVRRRKKGGINLY